MQFPMLDKFLGINGLMQVTQPYNGAKRALPDKESAAKGCPGADLVPLIQKQYTSEKTGSKLLDADLSTQGALPYDGADHVIPDERSTGQWHLGESSISEPATIQFR